MVLWLIVSACLVLLGCQSQLCLAAVPLMNNFETTIIHVDRGNGSNNSQCWKDGYNKTCQTLDLALAGAHDLLSTNKNASLTIMLYPGVYYLGPDSNLTMFNKTNDFSIVGIVTSDSNVTINCNRSNGFAFGFSQKIVIENIIIDSCQTNSLMPIEISSDNKDVVIALAFYNSIDITMRNVTIRNTNGIAILFYNTLGSNLIADCVFSNNKPFEDPNTNNSTIRGHRGFGGLTIVFFYCLKNAESYPKCTRYIDPGLTFLSSYDITDCLFEQNDATSDEFIEPRLLLNLNHFREHVSKGGGMSLLFHGYAIQNRITITRCKFVQNSASWGGGAHVCFRDYGRNNSVVFEDCQFDSNASPVRTQPGGSHGGGADVVYLQNDDDDVLSNTVMYEGCTFKNNSALFGGGLSLQVSDIQAKGNDVHFKNCTFVGNEANVGAALDLSVSFLTSAFGQTTGRTQVILENCTYEDNAIRDGRNGLDHSPRIGNGGVYIYRVLSIFQGENRFSGNYGTALVLATWAKLSEHADLIFTDNTGIFGGALRFSGDSRLDIFKQTTLRFERNSAFYLGGAISASYPDIHSEVYQSSCFIRYQNPNIDPDLWETSFTFINNTDKTNRKNSIWVKSLVPCFWLDPSQQPDQEESINSTFCWKNWDYVNSDCHTEISSGGTKFLPKMSTNTMFHPGIPHPVPTVLVDDLGNDVSDESILIAQVIGGEAGMGNSTFFRADSDITILGYPNTTVQLTLQTEGPSGFTQECNVDIIPCPPGFVLKPYNLTYTILPANATPRCECSGNFYGTVECNRDSLTATLLDGYSMSYLPSSGQTIVGAIPFIISLSQAGRRTLPSKTSELDEALCGTINRTGLLCSQCQPGLSVVMGFSSLDCVNCTMGLLNSWLIFFGEQLLPTTLFFLFVILGNINAASAPFNAFIFFSQVMTVPLRYRLISPWIYSVGNASFVNAVITAENIVFIPYSIWNLDFKILYTFHHDVCFVKGNNILAHLAMEYVNAIYPLILIGVTFILIELHGRNFKPVVWLWKPFRVCFLRFRQTWNPKLSIINAFATFIIVSYVEFITTSVKLLAQVDLYSSDKIVGPRYFFDASLEYFGARHMPFAVLAIIVLCTFVVIPPLLMFLYPLKIVQKCIGVFNCKYRYWHSLRIFVDAIQGGYTDGTNGTNDRRFFAGFYFVFRIILITIYGVVTYIPNQYLLSISFLIIAILLFALLQPYKDPFYNKFDIAIFVNMLIIHFLDFYNNHRNIVLGTPSTAIWALRLFFLMLPLLYVFVFKGLQLVWRKSKIGECCLERLRKRDSWKHRPLEEGVEDSSKSFKVSSYKSGPRKRRRSSLMSSGRPRLVTISEVTLSGSEELPDRLLNPECYESLNKRVHTSPTGYTQTSTSPRTNSTENSEFEHLSEPISTSYGAVQTENNDGIILLVSQEMEDLSRKTT